MFARAIGDECKRTATVRLATRELKCVRPAWRRANRGLRIKLLTDQCRLGGKAVVRQASAIPLLSDSTCLRRLEIDEQSRGSGDSVRQLPEERQRRVDVCSLTNRRDLQRPAVGLIARIIHGEDRYMRRVERARHALRATR